MTLIGLFTVCSFLFGLPDATFLFSAYYLWKNKSPKLFLLLIFGFIYYVSGFWTLLMFKIFSLMLIATMNFDKIVSKYNMLRKLNETCQQSLTIDEMTDEEREDIKFFTDKFNYIDDKVNIISQKLQLSYAYVNSSIDVICLGITKHKIYTGFIEPLSLYVYKAGYMTYNKIYDKLYGTVKGKEYIDFIYSHYQGLYKIYDMYEKHNEVKSSVDEKTKHDFMEQMNSLMQNMNTMMMSMSEDTGDVHMGDMGMMELFNMIQPQNFNNEETQVSEDDNITITSENSDDDINNFLKEDKKEDIIDKILEETLKEESNIITEVEEEQKEETTIKQDENEESKDNFEEELQKVIETGELSNILSTMSNEMDKVKDDIIDTVKDIEESDIVRRRKKQENENENNTDSSNDTVGKKRGGRKKKTA